MASSDSGRWSTMANTGSDSESIISSSDESDNKKHDVRNAQMQPVVPASSISYDYEVAIQQIEALMRKHCGELTSINLDNIEFKLQEIKDTSKLSNGDQVVFLMNGIVRHGIYTNDTEDHNYVIDFASVSSVDFDNCKEKLHRVNYGENRFKKQDWETIKLAKDLLNFPFISQFETCRTAVLCKFNSLQVISLASTINTEVHKRLELENIDKNVTL